MASNLKDFQSVLASERIPTNASASVWTTRGRRVDGTCRSWHRGWMQDRKRNKAFEVLEGVVCKLLGCLCVALNSGINSRRCCLKGRRWKNLKILKSCMVAVDRTALGCQ